MEHLQEPMQFRIRGMDCAEEVAILMREVGALIAGDDRLSFDILNGRMAIAAGEPAVSPSAVTEAVARTRMHTEVWQHDRAQVQAA